MAKLTRYLQKIFANNSNQVGVFGTGADKETSKNVETLQSADYENGWSSAIITNKNYPIWQEMDGVQYGLSYQLKYLFQNGIPEWLSTETYYTNSYCRVGSIIYYSLQDNNTNHNPALNDGYWTPLLTSNRSIGEIIPSCVPLTDAGLHLLDGALISNGIYSAFITYIGGLSATYSDLFCTEAEWQTAVATYGVCGKFVYDSVNNTVRLPRITGFIEGGTEATLGDLTEAGLPNITGEIGARSNVLIGSLCSGAFDTVTAVTDQARPPALASSDADTVQGSFDASLSNTIYGNSSTVQPQSVKVLYYIVVATTTKTEIEVDIDEIATDLNGKADKDGSNMVTSVKNFDGQWVSSDLALASTVTYPTSTNIEYDVSSYLPNDNYTYEVLVTSSLTTGSSTGNAVVLQLKSDIITGTIFVCGARTRTSSGVVASGCVTIPVGTGRKIIVEAHSSYVGTYSISLRAYRRIGTNS